MKDLYEILEVDSKASYEEIKKSYRRLAKKFHPDLNPGDKEAEAKLKEINLAYEVLSKEDKRRDYDRFGDKIFEGAASGRGEYGGFSDLFSDIFSDFFSGSYSTYSSNSRGVPGEDILKEVTIDFKDAYKGVKREIQVRRKTLCEKCHGSGAESEEDLETCPVCHGSGQETISSRTAFGLFQQVTTCHNCDGSGKIIKKKCSKCSGEGFIYKNEKISVDIPAGIDSQMAVRVSGKGHEGLKGGENGDLLVRVTVKPSQIFKREGSDLLLELPIRFTQAVLGDEIEIPTMDGMEKFTIPKGVQSGEIITLRNKGFVSLRSKKRGDLYVKLNIVTPTNINKEQEDLLKELDKSFGEEINGKKPGFFDKVKDLFD